MNSFCLGLLRFVLCAWLGAATLFVVTGVREVTSGMEPAIKNQLTVIRFPAYYLFGFGLTGLASICSGIVVKSKQHAKGKPIAVLCLLVFAIMIVDYTTIYTPLAELMGQPNARETAAFKQYHDWSKYINFFALGLCMLAAIFSLQSNAQTPNTSE
jgi:hypothetical protein